MSTFEEFGGFLLTVALGVLGLISGACTIVYSVTGAQYALGVWFGVLVITVSVATLVVSLRILTGYDSQKK